MGFIDGGLGGIISGIGNVVGSLINNKHQKQQQQLQMQHDKTMAGLNQANALEQMQVQNQYQVEQWNRENAYNDPSAVRARYEAAGLSPQSAFGTGSANGAGIAGGLSGAPSGSNTGSASNIMTNGLAGLTHLGSDILSGMLASSQSKLAKANADKAMEETLETKLKNEYEQLKKDLGVWLSNAEGEKADSELKKLASEREASRRPYYTMLAEVDYRSKLDQARKVKASADAEEEKVNLLVKDGILKEEQANKLRAEIATEKQRANLVINQAEHAKMLSKLAEGDIALRNRQTEKVLFDMINEGIKTGISAADTINNIVATWVPNPKMASRVVEKVTEMFNSKGKFKSKKVEKTKG